MRKDSEEFLKQALKYRKEIEKDTFEVNYHYFKDIPSIKSAIFDILKDLINNNCITSQSRVVDLEGNISINLTLDGIEYFDEVKSKENISQTTINVYNGGQVISGYDNAHISIGTNRGSSNKNNIVQIEKFKNNKKQDYIDDWNSRLFLHIDNDERPLTLADAFIMPDFDYHIKIGRYKFLDSDSLDDVIHKFIKYDRSLKILITGVPGIGKSSIVSWIANQYKYNDNIIVLRFRDWKIENLSNGLLNAICTSLSCENEDLENKILILDGFDEIKTVDIRDSLLRNFFNDILDYKNFKFIITSRPDYIDSYKFQNVFELLPFGIDKIKLFYQIIKGSELDINKINHDNLDILGIPVILYMALMVEIDITEDTTKLELYNRVFAEEGGIFDKFSYQGIAYDNGSQPLRDSENKKIYLRFLSNVAFRMFEKNELCIQKDECRIPKIEFNGSSMQVLEFPLKYLFENTKSSIEFIHKSIYEYFVAEYFYVMLCNVEKYKIVELAGIFGKSFNQKILEKEILEFLKYKFENNNKIVNKLKLKSAFEIMLENGMTYYTNIKLKKIIERELNIFINILYVIHFLEPNLLYIDGDLIGYYLQYNNKPFIDLSKLNLKTANLTRARLNEANLNRTNLHGANLTSVELVKANLTETNLTEANLLGTDLREAILLKADLREAKYLDMINLYGANLQASIWHKDDIQKLLHQLKETRFKYLIAEDENGQKKVYRKELFPDEKQ